MLTTLETPSAIDDDQLLFLTSSPDSKKSDNRPPPTVPHNLDDALSSVYAEEWRTAMEKEIKGHELQGTWEVVDAPDDAKVIGSRWAFSLKKDPDGNVKSFKARLVIQAVKTLPFLAQYGPSYAPLPSIPVLSTFFTLAGNSQFEIEILDFRQGYLAASSDFADAAPIFMREPPGFESSRSKVRVCRIRKALYGLPPSGRAFHLKVKEKLEGLSILSVDDATTLYSGRINGRPLLLILYVDDGAIAGEQETIDLFFSFFTDEFDIARKGPLDGQVFLGRSYSYSSSTGSVRVSQQKAINKALKEMDLEHLRPISAPAIVGQKLEPNSGLPVAQNKYQRGVGHLLWIAQTRPDISSATNKVARFSSNPGTDHWTALIHIFRFLVATKDVYLEVGLPRLSTETLKVAVDADFANDKDRKSTTGFAVYLHGSLISHVSKKQASVTTSTYGAEFTAMATAYQETEWITSILEPLLGLIPFPILMVGDNSSTIHKLLDPTFAEHAKHVDIKVKYLQQAVEKGFLRVEWTPSAQNEADLLTKPLPSTKAIELAKKMGMGGYPNGLQRM